MNSKLTLELKNFIKNIKIDFECLNKQLFYKLQFISEVEEFEEEDIEVDIGEEFFFTSEKFKQYDRDQIPCTLR